VIKRPLLLLGFKAIALMGAAGLVVAGLHALPPLVRDADLLGHVLVICGVVYGFMAAFSIQTAWKQFTTVQVAASTEAHVLGEIMDLTARISSREAVQSIHVGVRQYLEHVLRDEWQGLANGKSDPATQRLFVEVSDRIRALAPETDADARATDAMMLKLGAWAQTREKRVSWGLTRMPGPLWFFLGTLAWIAVLLLLIYPTDDYAGHLLCAAAAAGLVSLCQSVIRDIDNPFDGTWCISPDPFERLAERFDIHRASH
jgi:hypothetical protein